MVNRNNKKPAMAMVLIIIIITALSLFVMGSVKVVTKNHTVFTTGVGSQGTVNANKASGKFICYKDSDNNLKQILVTYQTNGQPVVNSSGVVDKCTLQIPAASKYEITAIGAGGGGAMGKIEYNGSKKISADGEDTIIFNGDGETKVTTIPKLFVSFSKYLSQSSVNEAIENFFDNLTLRICGSLRKYNFTSTTGGQGGCYNIRGADIETGSMLSYYSIDNKSTSNGDDAVFKITNSQTTSTYTAKGGYAVISSGGNYYNPELCTSTAMDSEIESFCNALNDDDSYEDNGTGKCCKKTTTTITSCNSCTSSSNSTSTSFGYIYTHDSGATNSGTISGGSFIKFSILHMTSDITEANAGSAGDVTVQTVPFLGKTGATTLTINASQIGDGGVGSSSSGTSGGNGGATTLTLETSTGDNITITAEGGAGGSLGSTRTLEYYEGISSSYDITRTHTYSGQNGKSASYTLSNDFGLSSLTAGISGANNNAATLFGASGASAGISWGVNALPEIEHAVARIQFGSSVLSSSYTAPPVTTYYDAPEAGGNGANGAIIITW